jgi:DNA-binding SARP family transcriptional activator
MDGKFVNPMVLGRARILARIAATESRLISIVAPAGFGKTTIANVIAEEYGEHVVCDVAGVGGLKGFAQHVIRALSQIAPERADALANDLFRHLQPRTTEAQLAGFVLQAWCSIGERNVYIFDNLEALAGQPAALDLLVRLIKAAEQRMLILCARPPFTLLNSRLIPPNEHLRLGIEELAFTRDETRAALGASIADAHVDAVTEITQGWPVAVLLFRQIAQLGQLERTLDETAGSPPEELRDYLLKEVLESIQGPLFDALVALVATASVGVDAARRATDGATTAQVILDLSARLPLVAFADGTCTIHPLISSIVFTTAALEIERDRLRAAESYERDARLGEAARLYLDAGLLEAGARCLEGFVGPYIERYPWATLDDLAERLPAEMLPNYPRLWAMLAWVRRGAVDYDVLIAEGTALREQLRADSQSLEAKQVNALLISLLGLRGDHDAVERIRSDAVLEEDDFSPGNVALLVSDTLHDALTGRMQGVADRYRRLMPLVHNDLVRAYFILRVDALVKTMSGRFDDALQAQRQADEWARSSGRSAMIAGLLPHRMFVMWLAGDDAGVESLVDEMRHSGATLGSVDNALIASAWETTSAEGLAERLPRARALLLLVLSAKTTELERRRMLLAQAYEAARRADDRWSELLIVTAGALGDPAECSQRLADAGRIAREIGQPELATSIASLSDGGDGGPTLHVFARRFGPNAELSPARSPIRVSVLSRTVWRGDEPLPMTRRALTLIIVLAVQGRVPGETLIDWLWSAREADVQTNALRMLVSRARRQLGDPSLIAVAGGAYELRSDIVVDFHRISQLVRSLSANDPLTGAQRAALTEAHEQFRPATWIQESVPSIDAAISATRHRVIERLAQDALDRGDIAAALTLADELRRYDVNDEAAYELLIRAHVRSGDTASALREYRTYSVHLKDDLGLDPSFSLDELLQA